MGLTMRLTEEDRRQIDNRLGELVGVPRAFGIDSHSEPSPIPALAGDLGRCRERLLSRRILPGSQRGL